MNFNEPVIDSGDVPICFISQIPRVFLATEDFPVGKYVLMPRLILLAPFYFSRLAIPLMKEAEYGIGVMSSA